MSFPQVQHRLGSPLTQTSIRKEHDFGHLPRKLLNRWCPQHLKIVAFPLQKTECQWRHTKDLKKSDRSHFTGIHVCPFWGCATFPPYLPWTGHGIHIPDTPKWLLSCWSSMPRSSCEVSIGVDHVPTRQRFLGANRSLHSFWGSVSTAHA